jgi:cyclophilin family peptidyl-prolyl cis-trans isomerase
MKTLNFLVLAAMALLTACGTGRKVTTPPPPLENPHNRLLLIETSYGNMVLELYDSTPQHRDNFIKLVKERYFDSLLFHRVMNSFMIQGGDPDSKRAQAGTLLGNGGPGYTLPAEFRPYLFHKRGVLAAARTPDDVNPQKVSNGSQFYIAQGRRYTDAELDQVEQQRLKGVKLSAEAREYYKTVGGIPFLDTNYTVFGELIAGQDVIDKIAAVNKDRSNRPVQDIRMFIKILR